MPFAMNIKPSQADLLAAGFSAKHASLFSGLNWAQIIAELGQLLTLAGPILTQLGTTPAPTTAAKP
jgi:hypothetical protein